MAGDEPLTPRQQFYDQKATENEIFERLRALEITQAETGIKVGTIERVVTETARNVQKLTDKMSRHGGIITGIAMAVSAVWAAGVFLWDAFFNGSAPTH